MVLLTVVAPASPRVAHDALRAGAACALRWLLLAHPSRSGGADDADEANHDHGNGGADDAAAAAVALSTADATVSDERPALGFGADADVATPGGATAVVGLWPSAMHGRRRPPRDRSSRGRRRRCC